MAIVILRDLLGPVLLLAAAWIMPSVAKPTVPFGVRVPADRTHDPLITEQRRIYRWWIGTTGSALVLAGLVLSLLVQQVLVPVIIVAALLGVIAPGYLHARLTIRSVKQREGWFQGKRQVAVTDTARHTEPPRFPWLWALPAVLILAATVVYGVVRYPDMPATLLLHFTGAGQPDRTAAKSIGSAFGVVFLQAGLTVLLLAMAYALPRLKPDLDPTRPRRSANQNRRFASGMARTMLLVAACVNLSLAFASWQIWRGATSLAAFPIVLPTLVGAAGLLVFGLRYGQVGNNLPTDEEPANDATERDDDRFWKLGLLYVNCADHAILVPKRFGIGWTLNLGNPIAIGGFVVFLAACLVLPMLAR
ncbi:DUF1648 domain-containing protein [Amycolatopsis sp.]|uniref:DUF1648 domain-containing protein n=1 Tax=Amycolatopsis sp. TaxID=37632 RepID=UPI002C2BB212|nr:DUF5808 domain-containing protein [Amycolatopsis sp.]HVV11792.1 DUF5808 domain-containing protein [Amycolatopsis sp.]